MGLILIYLFETLRWSASCKWRDAQRAMRNRQFIGYTLDARGRLFDSEGGGGGGLSNFVWTDNSFSAWARSGNLFSCGMGSGKFLFV